MISQGSLKTLWEPASAGSIRLKADPTFAQCHIRQIRLKADPTFGQCRLKADPTFAQCDTMFAESCASARWLTIALAKAGL